MKIKPLREAFERRVYNLSFDEQSLFAEVYGFAGQAGRVFLEGQLLLPRTRDSDTVLLFMHPASALGLLPLPTALVESGLHVMCCTSRYARNDTPLIMEKVLLDMGAHITYARDELGYANVVLVGWSGGGSLSIFYQAQAERPTITNTPSGESLDLAAAQLPRADAIMSIAAHLSRAETLTEWLDPAVTDEIDPDQSAPELDIYATDPIVRPPFGAAFLARFRAAQRARNRRITSWVETQLTALESANNGARERGFIVHRTMCDPRWIDPLVDPNERQSNWCYLGDPRLANATPAGLARYTTLRAWLSQWSVERTRSKTADNAPHISIPALVIENGADDATPASHPRRIYELLGSVDKRFERIDGATHYYRDQPEKQREVVELCRGWLSDRPLGDTR